MTSSPEARRIALGLLALRVSAGMLLIAGQGWYKLYDFTSRHMISLDRLSSAAELRVSFEIIAEFFCPLFVILGVATRLTAIPPWVSLVGAAVLMHGKVLSVEQQLALAYAVPFFVLMLTGAGDHSFDKQVMGHVRGGWFG